MTERALRLSVSFGENHTVGGRLASDVLLERLAAARIDTAALNGHRRRSGSGARPAPPVAGEPPWLAELRMRVHEFAAGRGGHAPVVRVTLVDGERFFLASAHPRPGPGVLTLVPHPERYDEMVRGERGPLAPRVLFVPERSIVKLELLARPPRGARSLVTFDAGPGGVV